MSRFVSDPCCDPSRSTVSPSQGCRLETIHRAQCGQGMVSIHSWIGQGVLAGEGSNIKIDYVKRNLSRHIRRNTNSNRIRDQQKIIKYNQMFRNLKNDTENEQLPVSLYTVLGLEQTCLAVKSRVNHRTVTLRLTSSRSFSSSQNRAPRRLSMVRKV